MNILTQSRVIMIPFKNNKLGVLGRDYQKLTDEEEPRSPKEEHISVISWSSTRLDVGCCAVYEKTSGTVCLWRRLFPPNLSLE